MTSQPLNGRRPGWVAPLCACGLVCGLATQAVAGDRVDNASLQEGPLASSAAQAKSDDLWAPRQNPHYVGLSVGTARFNMPCLDGMVCKRNGKAFTLYAGSEFSQRWGFELAYMRMSNMERDGNAVRVKGLSASLIGELPLSSRWKLAGRVGTNYAWTRMAQAANPAEPTGSSRGFGLSYGTGVSVDFAQGWAASLDWNRHDFKFVTGRDTVDTASLGVRYRF
jgi:OOP family OmpA-OmpF porin